VTNDEMPSLVIPDEVLAAVPEYGAGTEAVVIVDFQGVVLGLNKAAEELFGMESADIAGEFVEMLVPAGKRWGHQAYRRGYLAEPRDREMDPGLYPEAETADGELVPVTARLQPVRVDGRLFVAAHLWRDDSPRPGPSD
jgi:PAS domain S-box-containing protein